MKNLSFKKYTEFVSNPEDYTDEQINEIFGLFRNNEKLEKLKAEREKLKKETNKKVADWRAKKELEAQMKDQPRAKNDQRREANPRTAAGGRAAEMDWVASMNESQLAEGRRIPSKLGKAMDEFYKQDFYYDDMDNDAMKMPKGDLPSLSYEVFDGKKHYFVGKQSTAVQNKLKKFLKDKGFNVSDKYKGGIMIEPK